jgi:uncharacterized repeat protein (TIGR04052 family)
MTLATLAVACLVSSCGGGGGGVDAPTVQPITVEFTASLGAVALASPCGAPIAGLGTSAANARLQDLRFYISNLHLITAAGAEVPVQLASNVHQLTRGGHSVALIDLRDTTAKGACQAGNGHIAITGSVATGTYTGLGFTLGVPEALNHVDPQDPANAPLDNTDMGWDWTGGKKHLQVEINPENAAAPGTYTGGVVQTGGGAAATSFFVHLGNTGCTEPTPGAYQCSNINTRDIHFHGFNPTTQRIGVDLKALFASSNLQQNQGGDSGCMASPSDPECADMWSVFGATFSATGANVLDPANEFFHGETVFKAVAR